MSTKYEHAVTRIKQLEKDLKYAQECLGVKDKYWDKIRLQRNELVKQVELAKKQRCGPTDQAAGLEILTPYPPPSSKRYKFERRLDKYNHIMEFIRTMIQLLVFIMQVIILVKLS
jgi:hypothetical protein